MVPLSQRLQPFMCILALWIVLLGFSAQFAFGQTSNTCPRIWKSSDGFLETETAPNYQWYRNQVPIPGATQQRYMPTTSGAYSVAIWGAPIDTFLATINNTRITIKVVDAGLNELNQAQVRLSDGRNLATDESGTIQISNENRLSFSFAIEKKGYWTSFQRIHPTAGNMNIMVIMAPQTFEEFEAEEGISIYRGPFQLHIAPNAIVNRLGNLYKGRVRIAFFTMRPDEPGFSFMMPGGDFRAIDSRQNERFLYSYGFFSVEMVGPADEPLQLAEDMAAKWSMTILESQRNIAPDSIPLWHFDEQAIVWREQGHAFRIDDDYHATLPHFSSYNVDLPFNWSSNNGNGEPPVPQIAEVSGQTVDCNQKPLPGVPVVVGQTPTSSDESGAFRTSVPSGISQSISVIRGKTGVQFPSLNPGATYSAGNIPVKAPLTGVATVAEGRNIQVRSVFAKGNVQYSFDGGTTFQPTPSGRLTPGRPMRILIKDDGNCPVEVPLRMSHDLAGSSCRLIPFNELKDKPLMNSIGQALESTEPVFRLTLNGSGSENNALLNELPYFQPCLQEFVSPPASFVSKLNSFKNLQKLNMNGIQGGFPQVVLELIELRDLDLSVNNITLLPSGFVGLRHLEELNLNDNPLLALPVEIGRLTRLKRLQLGNTRLVELPASFRRLSNLKDLTISSPNLDVFPEVITQIRAMERLSVEGTFAQVPNTIPNLNYLTSLQIKSSQLKELPNTIGLTNSLKDLNLNGCQLASFPESFGRLSNLTSLHVRENRLSQLPSSFANLKTLERLELASNQFATFPVQLLQLDRLRSLDLSNNRITSLPQDLSGWRTNLRELRLNGNPIPTTEIDRIRRELPQVSVIY
jgi:Leucine-rich repeat (LRR) protein